MSYELNLIRLSTYADAQAAVDAWMRQPPSSALNPGPPVEAMEAEKRRLAEALLRHDPELSLSEFDYAGMAARGNIAEDEVRRQYRHIELDGNDATGIQITLWDDTADLTFPYGYSGSEAQHVLGRAWEYLEKLQQWGGFVTYDPQLDSILQLGCDFDRVLAGYVSDGNTTYHKVRALRRRRSRKH